MSRDEDRSTSGRDSSVPSDEHENAGRRRLEKDGSQADRQGKSDKDDDHAVGGSEPPSGKTRPE
jgi:hypothetical protein